MNNPLQAPAHTSTETASDPGRRALMGAGLAGATLWLARSANAQAMSGMDMGAMHGMHHAPAAPKPASATRSGAFKRPLAIPPELRGELQADGVRAYALRMQAGQSQLVASLNTPTWGYNGSFLGPALRIPRGRPVALTVANGLDQTSTTHWHGAHVPGEMDGGPHAPTAPGASQRSAFTLDQPAATLWYHPHPDMRTGAHVWAGMAGLLLVDDGLDARLGLPHAWGVDDIPLILQDRRLDARGRLVYMSEGMSDMMGMKGDRFLVNGREQPFAALPAQRVRLRLLNASNARVYNVERSDQRPFHMIASDAGLLPRPVEMRALLLAPAERAEIVLDLRGMQGKTLVLRSNSAPVVPDLGSSMGDSDAFDHSGFDLLQIRVTAPNARPGHLPAQLAAVDTLKPTRPQPRPFSLQGMSGSMNGMGGMSGMSSMGGATAPTGPGGMSLGTGGERMFSINHQYMDMAVINQQIRRGDTEIWEVSNDAEMAHPFHVHGTSFQILARNGTPPPEHERGWKDVVLLRRNETVRLIMRFGQPAGVHHPYMYHCHILEHEDNGMMGQFTVV